VSSDPFGLTAVGDTLYFFTRRHETGEELWRSDGTAAGTELVANIAAALDDGTSPEMPTAIGESLYFSVWSPAEQYELWMAGRGQEGAAMVGPGPVVQDRPGDLWPDRAAELGGTVYFGAEDLEGGVELWSSELGSTAATRFADLNPGPNDGVGVTPITRAGDSLYFSGRNATSGWELFRLGPPREQEPPVEEPPGEQPPAPHGDEQPPSTDPKPAEAKRRSALALARGEKLRVARKHVTVRGRIAKSARKPVRVTLRCGKTTVSKRAKVNRRGAWSAKLRLRGGCAGARRARVTVTYAGDARLKRATVRRAVRLVRARAR
jgi:ELWxxDGT repeat protein